MAYAYAKVHQDRYSGKHLLSFGKEGNGPGEISGYEDIICLENTIVIIRNYYIMFFDYSGKLLYDKKINDLAHGYHIQKVENGFVVRYPISPFYKLYQIISCPEASR